MEVPEYLKPIEQPTTPISEPIAVEPAGKTDKVDPNYPNLEPGRVPVVNSFGEVVTLPQDALQDALDQGYELATPAQYQNEFDRSIYGTTEQGIKAAAEAAVAGATFGLSTGLQTTLGLSTPEDIRKRAEQNPVIKTIGEIGGVVGSSFLVPGGGLVGAAERAGAAGAAKLIPKAAQVLEAESALRFAQKTGVGIDQAASALRLAKEAQPAIVKIGTSAADLAIQGALQSTGNEVSKKFYQQPDQTVGSVITDVGLGGLIGGVVGGGIGAVNPLWKATFGNKTDEFLSTFKKRINGESIPVMPDLEVALKDADPIIKARFAEDPRYQNMVKNLYESGTPSGEIVRQVIDKFQDDAGDQIVSTLKSGNEKTIFELGDEIKDKLRNFEKTLSSSTKDDYAKIGDASTISLDADELNKLAQDIHKTGLALEKKKNPIARYYLDMSERIAAQENLGDVWNIVSDLGKDLNKYNSPLSRDTKLADVFGDLKRRIDDWSENYIESKASALSKVTEDPEIATLAKEFLENRKIARKNYAKTMSVIDDLADAAKLPRVKSLGDFAKALDEKPSIELVNSLFTKNNVEKMRMLEGEYPEIFNLLKTAKRQQIIDAAVKGEGDLRPTVVANKVNELPPEIQKLVFSEKELETIKSNVRALKESNKRAALLGRQFGTEKWLDNIPMGIGAGIGFLLGGHTLAGAAVGYLAKELLANTPDAARLGLIKFLGSSGEVDSAAFKGMIDYAEASIKGETKIIKATKRILQAAPVPAVKSLEDRQRARKRLEKRIDEIAMNPQQLLDVGGEASAYMPDHAIEMTKTASNAINYLQQLKPKQEKSSVFDSKPVVNPVAEARYNRALDIANEPLTVMDDIAKGTITENDVQDLMNLAPAAYDSMKTHLLDQITDKLSKEELIPYKTRLGLSVFLQQPIDSTMQPQAILDNQNLIAPGQVLGQTIPGQRQKHSFSQLNKISGQYLTPQQARMKKQLT